MIRTIRMILGSSKKASQDKKCLTRRTQSSNQEGWLLNRFLAGLRHFGDYPF